MFNPQYVLMVGIAVAVAIAFPVTRHMRGPGQKRDYYILQFITLIGAVLGAKLSVLIGDLDWPRQPITDWSAALHSGRSITGALILGFLFAEIAKPLLGYKMPPNDRFAAIIPFSIAIGRVGCFFAGCCGGVPYNGWCAIADAHGVPRHPTQLYEIAFQLSIGAAFIYMVRRRILFGRLFAVYLVAYGIFRFFTEFIRDTPKTYGPLSGYQMICFVMVALGAAFLLKRSFAPPLGWAAFKAEMR